MTQIRYTPAAVPVDAPRGLKAWLASELRRVADWMLAPAVDAIIFTPLAAPPARPVEGMVVFANGTTWDPGDGHGHSGPGLYMFIAGAWHHLDHHIA